MTFDFWKKTRTIKPFSSVEEFEQFQSDLIKDCSVPIRPNSPTHKATAKKGMALGVSYDSFAEYTFMKWSELVGHSIVERNQKSKFITYVDDECKQRKWYPDFIVNGQFVEVKGVMHPKDVAKKAQHPEVEWVFTEDTRRMAAELDQKFPGWRAEFVPRS